MKTLQLLVLASTCLLAACSPRDSDTESFGPDEPESGDWVIGAPLAGEAPTEPVNFTLSGTISYQDRLYGPKPDAPTGYGFTGTESNPVRRAVVEVVNGADEILASSSTGPDGGYIIGATGAGELRLRIFARSDASEVTVFDSGNRLIAVVQPFIPAVGNISLDIEIPWQIGGADFVGGAFNLLDVFSAGGEFVQARSGQRPGPLNVFWEPGYQRGTMFCRNASTLCPNGTGIYVLGGDAAGDHDEYDDDVLWHEYGHFLEHRYDNLDSLGGPHVLGDTSQDLRLSWSEGWSNYLSGAIKAWLNAEGSGVPSYTDLPPSFYIDTANDNAFLSVDFAADEFFEQPQRYASNEGAVARLLWDLHRDPALGSAAVWDTFQAGLPQRSAPFAKANLESYWNAWMGTTGNDSSALLPHFLERRINYAPEAREAGESPATPTVLRLSTTSSDNSVARNFYLAPGVIDDVDYYVFTPPAGASYQAETFQLVNGTDTQISVTPQGSGTTTANDNLPAPDVRPNIHGYCERGAWVRSLLASSVTFDASAGETILIQVNHPAKVPAAAGYYGGYTIRVSTAGTSLGYPCP